MKLKITLRDLFWLTFVAAVALGWYVREADWENRLQHVRDQHNVEVEKVNLSWSAELKNNLDAHLKRIRDHLTAMNAFRRAVEEEGYD